MYACKIKIKHAGFISIILYNTLHELKYIQFSYNCTNSYHLKYRYKIISYIVLKVESSFSMNETG